MYRKDVLLAFASVLLLLAVPAQHVEREVDVANPRNSNQFISGLEADGVDWWPMYHHDLLHTGYSTSLASNTNETLWTHQFGDWVSSSPTVHNGVVFVGSDDNKIHALNATTGEEIWNYPVGGDVRSSAAVADGRVYVGCVDRKLYCLDKATGNFLWQYVTGGAIYSSPAVTQDRVLFGSDDSKVYALNATTGGHLWNFTTLGPYVRSSPALSNGRVFVGSTDRKIYALNLTSGSQVWAYTTGGGISSSPAVVNGRVFVGSGDRKVYCLKETNGGFVWTYTTGGSVHSSPAVVDGNVYVGSDDYKMYCLNTLNGQFKWSYASGDTISSSPAVADDKVFFGSYDKKVYCLNTSTGQFIWSYDTGGRITDSSPAVADEIVFVGSTYVLPYKGKVYAFKQNTPPVASNLTITPATPVTTDDLIGNYEYYDRDGDPESGTEIRWCKNDVLQPELNDTLTVPSTFTSKGEIWNFTVKPKDGKDFGELQTSPPITIQNSLPSITGVEIMPDPAYNTSTLTATPTGWFDADGDSEGYIYQWQKYETESWQNISGATYQTLGPENFFKGGLIKILCTPGDGEGYGAPQEDTITISNSPPTKPFVDVTPDSPLTTDDLTCTFTVQSTDADNDAITYTYEWYRDQGTGFELQPDLTTVTSELNVSISSSNTAKGDVWKCVVTPHDGTDYGPSSEDHVTIGNSQPMASNPAITPAFPYTMDGLTATYTYSDVDDDPESGTEIRWYKNGALQPAYNDLRTIPSSATEKGEAWYFTVRPKDGTDFGDLQTSPTVTIQNSAPSIIGVNIMPDPAYTYNDLTALPYGWYDADGDHESYFYQWQKWNGTSWQDIPEATSNTLSHTNFVKGDQIKVVCTPFDGEDYGTQKEDTITISNSPPTQPVVDVTPNSPVTTDDLTCTVTTASTDPDPSDTITYTYEWYMDGILQPDLTTTTTALNVTIDSSNTAKGEVWRCVVTPNDGTDNGSSAQDEVTIRNSPPTIDSYYPLINPTIQEGESQEFNITKSDLDGDPLTVTWWLNQSDTGETSDSYIYVADYESAGTYNVTVVVSDGLSQASHQWTLTVTNIERDVSIINLILSKNVVGEGYSMSMNVTITNQGELTETFNVTVYANTSIIDIFTNITLTSEGSTTLTFTWNTAGVAKGNYTITAKATPLPGETDTLDNILTDGTVTVTIPGDVDGDFDVDLYDAVAVSGRYGAKKGGPRYDPNCDINNNNQIFLYDAVILGTHYGKKDP